MNREKYIKEWCIGCGLCQAVHKSKLEDNREGFPVCSEPEDVSWFESICPVYAYNQECSHDIWGNVVGAYVGYSSDEDVRYRAASGGGITEIASFLLTNGLVDGVLHCSYNPDRPTETINCISLTREEIVSRCGSRYSVSVPLKNIEEIIQTGKRYVYIGKPCSITALRNYLNQNQELYINIPYLISFFCAGEPSVNAQKKLLTDLNCDMEECRSITYRGNGWPGYTTIEKKDGTTEKMPYSDAWGSYLGRDIRRSCHFCMDGTGDAADIVCADFWHLDENGKPDFSEHDGRSLIIARNSKGDQVIKQAMKKGNIICEDDFTDKIDQLCYYQPHHYRRKATMKTLITMMRALGRRYPKYSQSYLDKYADHATKEDKKSTVMWSIKRVIKGRI